MHHDSHLEVMLQYESHDCHDTKAEEILSLSVGTENSTLNDAHVVDEEDYGSRVKSVGHVSKVCRVESAHIAPRHMVHVCEFVGHKMLRSAILLIVDLNFEDDVEKDDTRGHVHVDKSVDHRFNRLLAGEAIDEVEEEDADGECHRAEDKPSHSIHKSLTDRSTVPEDKSSEVLVLWDRVISEA